MPILSFIHFNSEIQNALSSGFIGKSSTIVPESLFVGEIKRSMNAFFATDRPLAYLRDVFGENDDSYSGFIRGSLSVLWRLIYQPNETNTILDIENNDLTCKSTAHGEHCPIVRDSFSDTLDSIMIDNVLSYSDGKYSVHNESKMMDKQTHPTRASMSLGSFRSALIGLYPHATHILPKKE